MGKSPGSEVAVSSGNYYYLKLPAYPSLKPTLGGLSNNDGDGYKNVT